MQLLATLNNVALKRCSSEYVGPFLFDPHFIQSWASLMKSIARIQERKRLSNGCRTLMGNSATIVATFLCPVLSEIRPK